MSRKEIAPSSEYCKSGQVKPEDSEGTWQHDGTLIRHIADCQSDTLYDSGRTDSGFLSGANILSDQFLSEEICPPSPPKSNDFDSEVKRDSQSYMRLDSGVDVGLNDQFSELSIKDLSLNDLSLTPSKTQSSGSVSPPSNINIQFSNINKSTSRSQATATLPLKSESSQQQNDSEQTSRVPWELYFQQDDDGDTQLHIAIIQGFIEVVFGLVRMVSHPRYLDIRNDVCQTPLHMAVLTGQARIARRLLVAGASPDVLDSHGNTALHLAVAGADLACVRALTEPVTLTEISLAELSYSPQPCARLCLPQDLDARNYDGLTCIHLAAVTGRIDILRQLIWSGANINAREYKSGRTALHMGAERGYESVVGFLLGEGRADPCVGTYAGRTAYQLVRRGSAVAAMLAAVRGGAMGDSSSDEEDSSDDEMVDETAAFRLRLNGGGLVNMTAA